LIFGYLDLFLEIYVSQDGDTLLYQYLDVYSVISHLTWKKRLADLESSMFTHTLNSIMLKLKMATNQEERDWQRRRPETLS
jgi:hypothetical protein